MHQPADRTNAERWRRAAPIDRRLRWRLRIYLVVGAVLLGLVAVRVAEGQLGVAIALLAIAGGTAIGAAMGRTHRLKWNESTGVVVGQMDLAGVAILLVYVVFSFTRTGLVEYWVPDADRASTIALAIAAGVMVGRILFTWYGVRSLLRALRQA